MRINKTVYDRLLKTAPEGTSHILVTTGPGFIETTNHDGVYYRNEANGGAAPWTDWAKTPERTIALPVDLDPGVIEVAEDRITVKTTSGEFKSARRVKTVETEAKYRVPHTSHPLDVEHKQATTVMAWADRVGEHPHQQALEIDEEGDEFLVMRWMRGPDADPTRFVDIIKVRV